MTLYECWSGINPVAAGSPAATARRLGQPVPSLARLRSDLPPDLKVANKPGELEAVRNDSGIVFVEGRPYVICVMTGYLRNERDGEDAISKRFEAVGA